MCINVLTSRGLMTFRWMRHTIIFTRMSIGTSSGITTSKILPMHLKTCHQYYQPSPAKLKSTPQRLHNIKHTMNRRKHTIIIKHLFICFHYHHVWYSITHYDRTFIFLSYLFPLLSLFSPPLLLYLVQACCQPSPSASLSPSPLF